MDEVYSDERVGCIRFITVEWYSANNGPKSKTLPFVTHTEGQNNSI